LTFDLFTKVFRSGGGKKIFISAVVAVIIFISCVSHVLIKSVFTVWSKDLNCGEIFFGTDSGVLQEGLKSLTLYIV
jgi:hypothetical protein